jgi:adenylate cyclase
MAEGSFKRKLAAVFSADVVGYSRLMGEDEAATVRTLETYKGVMSELIRQHRGRVVDSPGDNLLAEFPSVVDAVQCAVATQNEFKARNAELPENRKMQFRIGINLGDVIEEGERIYGDGVNIAARLEALAEPGGICVSKTAFDHIESKLPLGYEYLGEQTVKNIAKPVGAYSVLLEPRVTVKAEAPERVEGGGGRGQGEAAKRRARSAKRRAYGIGLAAAVVIIGATAVWQFVIASRPRGVEKADPKKMAHALPDKPSIAVLPFANLSGDPQQEFLCDGLTEDLITALSKVPNLFVIARNSTATYKGKPVKVQQVAEDLGVRYVLEGSIQKAAQQVRITAQLIDALKGHHIWSERYDREMKEFFALQDRIALETLKAIDVKLARGEGGRIHGKGTDKLEAYLKFLQARELCLQPNRENIAQARQLTEEVIRLDPNYPIAYHTLAVVSSQEAWLGISKAPRESLMKAIELEHKAISLDDSCAPAHANLGFLYVMIREHEKGIAAGERAIEIAPNLADAYAYFAQVLCFSGRPEEAVAMAEKAFRLNPVGPSSYYYLYAAHSYGLTGRYEDAVRMSKELASRWPSNVYGHIMLAAYSVALGRVEEARAAAQEVLRIDPKFSAQRNARMAPYKDPARNTVVLERLRKAGLPD